MEQAAAWFALLYSGDATDADRAGWQRWLQQAEDHRAAWQLAERVGQRFAPLQSQDAPRLTVDCLPAASQGRTRRRRLLGLAVAALGGGVLGWSAWGRLGPAGAWLADYRTATGERRETLLADGTRLWLGSASAVDQAYGASLRRLQLLAGEILVQTAADPARPLVVDTAHGRMQALGTRFGVRLEANGSTLLSVYEGRVRASISAGAAMALVEAGQQLRFNAQGLQERAPADPAREAWSRGILLAHDRPLGEVVAELARYRHGVMQVSPQVAQLPVLGSYPLDDVESALAMLERALPIRVAHPLPGWTRIGPAER